MIVVIGLSHNAWLRSFHPNRTCTRYTYNSINVNPRNEIKKGGPNTTFRDRGQKSTPGAIYFVKESHAT